MCVVAAGVGAVAGGVGSLMNAVGGGGGGGGAPGGTNYVDNLNSLGQGLTGILSGGVAGGLGISGLAGGNLNQLQAGATAANPFGAQSNQYYGPLSSLLTGGLQNQIGGAQGTEQNLLNSVAGKATINTNPGALSGQANISTPGATGALTGLVNNPQSASLPASIQNILGTNPYSFTAGQQAEMQTGLDKVNATMAAQGLVGSGAQMTGISDYAQETALGFEQQNFSNLFGAQSANTQALSTQGGLASNLMQLLSGQQQQSFGNQLNLQQLQSTQQQATAGNFLNLLSAQTGIGSQGISGLEGLLGPLLTASQAQSSSPVAAGDILSNLGAANQASAGNLTSGIGGLASGLGNLATGLSGFGNFGGISTMGSENMGASSTSTPDDLIAGYTG